MASFRKRGDNWFYRIIGADGRQVERKGCSDRRATEQMAAAAEAEAARIRGGFVTAAEVQAKRHAARPICEHVDEYHADQLNRGLDARHASGVRSVLSRTFKLSNVPTLASITPEKVQKALATLQDGDMSIGTARKYLRAVRSFVAWCQRTDRLDRDPIKGLKVGNPETDRRRVRRALTGDEVQRILTAAEGGPVVSGITGLDRAWLYRVALATGFRLRELYSLERAAFHLEGSSPFVALAAAASKNKKGADQPLPASIVEPLRQWLASKPVKGKLWPKLRVKHGGAVVLRRDLKTAGIEFETDEGSADFHALRCTYITRLVASGASVKTCQVLARHSDPALTIGVYAKASVFDLETAVDAVPALVSVPEAVALAGTGTNDLALRLPYERDFSGRKLATRGKVGTMAPVTTRAPVKPENQAVSLRIMGGAIDNNAHNRENTATSPGYAPAESKNTINTGEKTQISDHASLPLPYGPDLALVIEAWDHLPEATRNRIMALVRDEA